MKPSLTKSFAVSAATSIAVVFTALWVVNKYDVPFLKDAVEGKL